MTGTPSDLTLGELARQITKVEEVLRDDIHQLAARLDRLDFVPAELYAADKVALERRVVGIETAHREDHHRLRNNETITQNLPGLLDQAAKANRRHDERLTALEAWKTRTIGLAIGVGIGSGVGTGLLTQVLAG
jgi:hypothetical protein